MMTMIHAIGPGGYWTGASREIGDNDGCPAGWTRAPLPDLGEGEYAVFAAPAWSVTGTAYAPRAAPSRVPASVSPAQMRIALDAAGLLDQIEDYVAGAPAAVRIRWEYATAIERNNETIAAGAAELAQVGVLIDLDALFIAAGRVKI